MSSTRIRGIIGACLTPLTSAGAVDHDALVRQIDYLVADVDAIAIAAVEASEYAALPAGTRRDVLRRGVAAVDGRVPVIAGASSCSVREVLDLAGVAAGAGADLVQVLMPRTPWGTEPTPGELVAFFTRLDADSPLPIVAYHHPGPGADPPPEVFVELSALPSVAYFKDSSRDVTRIARLIEAVDRTGRAGYFTTMQPLLMTLLMGGSGATMPPPGTRIAARVLRAFDRDDLDKAREWQRVFSIFPSRWARYGLTPVMKAAMRHAGLSLGTCLDPFGDLSPEHDREIARFVSAVGLAEPELPDDVDFAAVRDAVDA
jgi:4-hydroxy-tetrahydrodipicolinate synthase